MSGRGGPLAHAIASLGVLAAGAALVSAAIVVPAAADVAGAAGPSLTSIATTGGEVSGVLTAPPSASTTSLVPDRVEVAFGPGPGVAAELVPIARQRRSTMIVIDTSGSMAGAGLAAAQDAAAQFLAHAPADVRIGLESFAARGRVLVAPTQERARVREALGRLRAGGGTALYDAVRTAVAELRGRGSGTVLLLSDGSDTTSARTLASAERDLATSGVRPVVVAFRTGHDQDAVLRELAHAGNGAMTQVLDKASLRAAFGAAARALASQVRVTVPIPRGLSGVQHLTVTAHAGRRAWSTTADVSLPAVPVHRAVVRGRRSTIIPTAPSRGAGPVLWWGAAGVFAGLLALILTLASPRLATTARRRLRELDAQAPSHRGLPVEGSSTSLQGLSEGLTRAADAYIGARASAARTGVLLERAAIPLQLNEWYVLRTLAIPVFAGVLWLLLGDSSVLTLLVGALVGAIAPALALRFLAARRARKFELQLPDVLTLLASSLSTGFSLPQALDGISRDAAQPAAKEFSRALAETRIGVDLEDALDRVAERMDSTNLAWTTMAVRIQRKVGGNLAEVMRTTARTLRDRESLQRQVRALSAEGRLSAYILIGLPLVLALYLYLTDRSYISVLWQQSFGVMMLVLSAVMMVIGIFWMKRIVEVKV